MRLLDLRIVRPGAALRFLLLEEWHHSGRESWPRRLRRDGRASMLCLVRWRPFSKGLARIEHVDPERAGPFVEFLHFCFHFPNRGPAKRSTSRLIE
jgi:hypothetical protein